MGIAVSLMLVFKPQFLARISRVANRWLSTRGVELWLDRSIGIERWVYRHHRVVGLLVIVGAGYILAYFGWRFDKAVALKSLSAYVPHKLLLVGLPEALVLIALVGASMSLIVGVVMCLRPSLLRGVEQVANKWVSAPAVADAIDRPHADVDLFVNQHARAVGWLLLVGSAYLFFVMFRWVM